MDSFFFLVDVLAFVVLDHVNKVCVFRNRHNDLDVKASLTFLVLIFLAFKSFEKLLYGDITVLYQLYLAQS